MHLLHDEVYFANHALTQIRQSANLVLNGIVLHPYLYYIIFIICNLQFSISLRLISLKA